MATPGPARDPAARTQDRPAGHRGHPTGPAPARPQPVDPGNPAAGRLAELQRTAGNRAVTDLVRTGGPVRRAPAPAPAPAPAGAGPAPAPTSAFTVNWTYVIGYGPLDRTRPRDENIIWTGDKMSIFAVVSDPHAKDLGLMTMSTALGIGGQAGDATVAKPRWSSADTVEWEITATTPGKRLLSFLVAAPDGTHEQRHEVDLTVAADARVFKDRCSSAESVLNAKHAAGRKWFMDCFHAYKTGYEAQSAALEAQRNAEKLAAQLLFGVMFAVAGGAVGGAVAQMESVTSAAAVLKTEFNGMAAGAFTDAAKDLGKYVARIPATLGGPGKVPGGGAGGSVDPAAAGVGGKGAGAVAALDPLDWMTTIDGKIAGERAAIGQVIADAHLKADRVAVTQPGYEFDWDPVEVVMEGATIAGRPIDDLGPVPTALQYERACWEVWLANYGYKLVYYPSDVPFGAGYGVEENVGGKLRDRIDEVAKKFGESGDDWISRYGAPSRAKAEAEKAKRD